MIRFACALLLLWPAAAACADDPPPPKVEHPDTAAQIEQNKSYGIPAAEIVLFDFLLNRFNRWKYGSDYAVSRDSMRRNLRSGFVVDSDPYKTNQLGHPYQGSMYHGFARSAG